MCSICIRYMSWLHCTALQEEMEAWRGQSNSSLNYVVSQLKSLCKLLRAMQNNCNCCVRWRKIFPVPENLLQLILCKPFIHTLHKGHTHVHWYFYTVSCIFKYWSLQSSWWLHRPSRNIKLIFMYELISWPLPNYINWLLH